MPKQRKSIETIKSPVIAFDLFAKFCNASVWGLISEKWSVLRASICIAQYQCTGNVFTIETTILWILFHHMHTSLMQFHFFPFNISLRNHVVASSIILILAGIRCRMNIISGNFKRGSLKIWLHFFLAGVRFFHFHPTFFISWPIQTKKWFSR